ncbi:hypothetical protein DCO58_05605 [Helicobacter saguini]|uniref:Lipoprotein n=1 Tax=Helicobacter saguini TaxID=1548018 RepID=A0A347VTA6_9HELI|nr:hypothetical protein [Helicobacter saguini]MWV62177.1 hypothetical protein [Helicobacter saguini]MWV67150.1 hypothetical protein [Helicobacter saguini]MWV69502.1 hypothetical protein [Helicobacter saguini]MWV70947.1 hypothetical protein [Helicobacter saguini]TLD92520.1 hypothetical protein LS64_010030 [Helicobacter saguini]
MRIYRIFFSVFVAFFLSGCTFYLFDTNYYKAKKIAKNYSGIYIFDKNLYDEITQIEAQNKDSKLQLQKNIESNLKNKNSQTTQLWLDSKARFENIAASLSGYKNPKNAKRLFIVDSINKAFPPKLKNGLKYYDVPSASLDSISAKIPQNIESKLDSMIKNDKNFKLQRVIYPQYFYVNESGETTLISAIVVYLYTNINRVYEIKTPQHSTIQFSSGEWKHLYKNNIFYAD